jgi:hypothetical protein
LQSDNGTEFQNHAIRTCSTNITPQYCDRDDKKCLGVAEICTIKLMIEKYLTRMNTNQWIGSLKDVIDNYNSSYHSSIKKIAESLELFDEVDLIRSSIAHNNKINNSLKSKKVLLRM